MMPLVETAARTPAAPFGLNPSAAVKFEPWKLVIARTKIVSSGMPTFHQVAVLLVLASLRTLRKFIAVKSAISATETTMPVAVSTFWPPETFIQLLAKS